MRQMKDSGNDWISIIPISWKINKIKYDFAYHKYIPGLKSSEYNRLALTMNGVVSRSKEDSDGLQPKDFMTYQLLKKGEIVFKLIDLQNISTSRVGLAHDTGLVSPAYIILSAYGDVIPEFAEKYFLMLWYRCIFNALGDNGVRSSLNVTDLLNVPICYPEKDEQRKIVTYLDNKINEINILIDEINRQIEILKAYKKSLVSNVVTKGINPDVILKDSSISWINKIPSHWNEYRISDLYEDRNERGNDDLPLLTVSINTGVSNEEIDDSEKDRVFVRSEDKTKYKRVYPGDLTYNMMRAWQGGLGAVRVEGMVSPAYIVAKPKGKVAIDSRFVEALLRSPLGIEEMNRFSYGIMDFRKRLYWPQFKCIKVALPDIKEQKDISDFIDEKNKQIMDLIIMKEEQIKKINEYKKSMIYEYVTGKKRVI